MNGYDEVAQEIRAFLLASDQTLNDRLAGLASDYARACSEVNARLARCAQLLRQGLRSEAIHLAETEPNLLELLGCLDFAERPDWLELIASYNLDTPPDLDLAAAEFLNGAYSEHDPLEKLLKAHRRLALALAPLAERIAVLRDLARVDAANTIWLEDLRAYEQARFKQIQTDVVVAAKRFDGHAVAAFDAELASPSWSSRPPLTLVQGVRKVLTSVRQHEGRQRLPQIGVELDEAFAAFDVERARRVRERWNDAVADAGLDPDAPLIDRAEPALLWVAEEDRKEAKRLAYSAAVNAFELALEGPADRDELGRLRFAVTAFDQGVPEVLELRYRSLVEAEDLAGKRRTRFRLAAVVGTAAIAAGLIVWFAVAYERAESAQRLAMALTEAVAAGRVEEVGRLLADSRLTRPELLRAVAVTTVMPDVNGLLAREEERSQKFETLLTESASVPTGESPPKSLAQARSLARTDEERKRAEQLHRKLERDFRQASLRLDESLMPELERVSRSLGRLESGLRDPATAVPDARKALLALNSELYRLTPASGPVSEAFTIRSGAMSERLKSLLAELDLKETREKTELTVTGAVRELPAGVDGYVRASQRRAEVFPNTVQANEIGRILGAPERSCWGAALAWSEQAREWAANPAAVNPAEARRRTDLCTVFLKAHPLAPDAPAINDYLRYLDPIAKRGRGAEDALTRLETFLSDSLFDGLYAIRYLHRENGVPRTRVYYTAKPPSDESSFFVYYRFDFSDDTRRTTLTKSLIESKGLSPQTNLARELKYALSQPSALTDWDRTVFALIRKIVATEMDPICKLSMLCGFMERAGEGSLPLRTALEPARNSLAKAKDLEKAHWMDPEGGSVAEAAREEARNLLFRFTQWDDSERAARAEDQRLRSAFDRPARPVGWLCRTVKGWGLRLVDPSWAREGDLLIAVPSGDRGVWKPLVKLEGTKGEWEAAPTPDAAECRLVFQRPKAPPESQRIARETANVR